MTPNPFGGMSAEERKERELLFAKLTEPFASDEIEKLPKLLNRNDQRKGRCQAGTQEGHYVSADGHYCGGWHARSIHLDYVGHAGITMRLNDVVGPEGWSWEPLVYDEHGVPFHARGEFWIKLTILGVTKLGVGDDYNGSSKQAIGDALRNAAMRFGIGTYLWSKSEAAASMAQHTKPPEGDPPPPEGQPLGRASEQSQRPPHESGAGSAETPTGPAPTADSPAQALAETVKRVRSVNSLLNVYNEAKRKSLLSVEIGHPRSGEITTLGKYIGERKAEFEQEPQEQPG